MPGRELAYQGRNIRIEYEGSLAGFRHIAMNPVLLATCVAVATTRALPYATSISPVDQGTYVSSWKVEPGVVELEGGPSTIPRRVAGHLINTADHAAAVEWGNKATNGKGQHILRQTIDYLNATG